VRNRVAKIKSDYRKAYEECGIAMPGGPAVSGKTDHPKPKTPAASQGGKKRAAKEMSSDDDEHFGGAGKKTAKKAKKVEEYDIELEGGFDGIKIEEYYEEI
jgi:hypothetical protein